MYNITYKYQHIFLNRTKKTVNYLKSIALPLESLTTTLNQIGNKYITLKKQYLIWAAHTQHLFIAKTLKL